MKMLLTLVSARNGLLQNCLFTRGLILVSYSSAFSTQASTLAQCTRRISCGRLPCWNVTISEYSVIYSLASDWLVESYVSL